MSQMPKDPLVVVIGSTGTGKSKLAVDLATKFNGEIINSDAMQMYKGLPIITNKIPEHERNGIKHHLLDFIGLEEAPWTVTQFVRESSRIIDDIRSRGKLPVVVGGTHYYTHALLFPDATLTDEAGNAKPDVHTSTNGEEDFPILSRPTEEIFQKLQEVDSEMASRWHPRDRRKIQRSLEIWLRTGRKASEVYAEQEQRRLVDHDDYEGDQPGQVDGISTHEVVTGLRFPTLLLWLEADDAVLKPRLNDRVDTMVKSGLVDEAVTLSKLDKALSRQGIPANKSMGIWVSIGYKELQPWVDEHQTRVLDSAQPSATLTEAIESVKAGTRRYAKRQNRYIRIRLANALQEAKQFNMLFALDCSDLTKWDSEVSEHAERLVQSFMSGDELPDHKSLSPMAGKLLTAADQSLSKSNRVAKTCDICEKTMLTDKEWHLHLGSRGHKKMVAATRKREMRSDEKFPGTSLEDT
ncbi:tRNA dimethylallyltransferase, mitochondrial [Elasticomyces elasticus]|uniref:tRNA dimethylallyltransferase n=1 Tax=Exophiala sideris TaxID=1016849 RepID=A0ABR0J6N4_9EURO|nr:tRNA dimethylallyltransferase, mitochondrial [Elasticomyces elasticus]KAK5029291.1 tRNA dimethylallyltransferase, mitochondrial [Exophiala sideris]KAK5037015.1 tRNA dimethylallyltransferase, mitochondrial [Exophiala sideris]KAK5057921.1 tRNA dimethylallyltransferase, mitochondrial [Exophiala sideris]KAK5181880.1 tRNA dimethylallyltransferase, mitochondrial [Eurotiomycetes sp. CCFEE 6388]